MGYYCEQCKKEHDGFQSHEVRYPDDYNDLTEEEKETKVREISKGILTIEREFDFDVHVKVIWPQRVQQTEEIWVVKTWVKIHILELTKLLESKNQQMHGELSGRLPWFNKKILGYPVQFKYLSDVEEFAVGAIRPGKNDLVQCFYNGITMDLALDVLHRLNKKKVTNK